LKSLVAYALDLGFGRYENSLYTITDVEGKYYPGRDYQNFNIVNEESGPTRVEVIDR
jgi:hypothetical protein